MSDRTLEERYRVYTVTPAGELVLHATTPSAGGIGVVIVTLAEEEQWSQDDRLGVLDTFGDSSRAGRWLVNPYAKPADTERIVRGSHQEEDT